ncbi:MAG: type I-E CRISPR-associated protein Cse1/CasA, partial [Leptospiraceae bacterium]|nr:type I-E CRISPR-associated protein Cse1/CasA [Leptospiraceae bacterium]
PYERSKKDKEGMNAVVTKPYHFLYKNWPVMIGARQDAKAAIVVNKAIERLYGMEQYQLAIHAFGYEVDNMKAIAWYDEELPLFRVPQDKLKEYKNIVNTLVEAAEKAGDALKKAIKEAWSGEKEENQKKDGKKAEPKIVPNDSFNTEFYKSTEKQFYSLLAKLANSGDSWSNELKNELKKEWYSTLKRAALTIFSNIVESGDFRYENLKKIVYAHIRLEKELATKIQKKVLGIV